MVTFLQALPKHAFASRIGRPCAPVWLPGWCVRDLRRENRRNLRLVVRPLQPTRPSVAHQLGDSWLALCGAEGPQCGAAPPHLTRHFASWHTHSQRRSWPLSCVPALSVNRALAAERFRADRAARTDEPEAHDGSPLLAPNDSPTPDDLEPASEALTALASLVVSGPAGSRRLRSPEVWRYQLSSVLVRGMTGPHNLAPPVFCAFARALRILSSPSPKDLGSTGEELQRVIRSAVDMVVNIRPRTRMVIAHLEMGTASTCGRLTLRQLCQELATTRNGLTRLLKVDTGLTFRQWRWAILMRPAVRRLAGSK
jgi:AraC-like DNA-binding protein